jgi:hypothetical protein
MRLASGLEIADPGTILRGYAAVNYNRYDGVPVAHDNELREEEIRLSRQLNSRLSNREAAAVHEQRAQIQEALTDIPIGTDLLDVPLGVLTCPGRIASGDCPANSRTPSRISLWESLDSGEPADRLRV